MAELGEEVVEWVGLGHIGTDVAYSVNSRNEAGV